ncbi:MAG: hypothetical protein P1Q69_08355 [Candidatus Thorarchaeota archaeon]|nr:hypothetical protein [Candidatus Thorarchaeota archaeon]
MAEQGERRNEISEETVGVCCVIAIALILTPVTSGISIMFLIVFLCCYGCVGQSEKSQAREVPLHQSIPEKDELSVEQSILEKYDSSASNVKFDTKPEDSEDISLDRYIFPSKCPHCHANLSLDEIEWVETNSALCPNCESLIKAERI